MTWKRSELMNAQLQEHHTRSSKLTINRMDVFDHSQPALPQASCKSCIHLPEHSRDQGETLTFLQPYAKGLQRFSRVPRKACHPRDTSLAALVTQRRVAPQEQGLGLADRGT